MLPWTKMIHLGDPGFTVPVAASITVALLASRAHRLALYWMLFFASGMLVVAFNKIAYMTWGIGVEAMAFKAVSGHATGASAILPVLFNVLLVLARAARAPTAAPARPSALQPVALEHAGIGAGLGLAMLVAVLLVLTCAHSLSEAVAGYAIGILISIGALACAGPLQPARPLISLLWLAVSFVAVAWLMRSLPVAWWLVKAARLLAGQQPLHSLALD